MNAAIDQQCELYIKENNLEKKLKKINKIYSEKESKDHIIKGFTRRKQWFINAFRCY
jgi:methylmalonyl-CoA mutase